MANEDKKDFNAMLQDNKDMPKFQIITDVKSIEKYGGNKMYFAPPIAYDEVMKKIPYGKVITVGKIREFFAKENDADFTEPITAGNLAFASMFLISVGAIIIQLLLAVNLRLVLGETLIALVGGIVYAFIMVHNGIWDKGLSAREALWRDFLTSVICAGIFSVFYGICLRRMGATEKQTIYFALLFLGGITIVAFIVLRVLSYFNRNRCRISVNGEQRDIPTTKTGSTKIYNAKDIVEAGRIIELLKEQGIAAFSQEASASVAMHGALGFGMYGVDVLVEGDEAKKAIQIIEAADDSQSKEKF